MTKKTKHALTAYLIRSKRERLNMTQLEFAAALGMAKYGDRTLRRWEQGLTSPSALELQFMLNYPEGAPFADTGYEKYKAIDLFAGIGGIRLGFKQTGKVQFVLSSEIDKFARKTYGVNFGETPLGDITQISAQEIPNHDILLGGFPCQAFSQAGKKLGFEDTRGSLFFEIARIIQAKRPKAFMLENVKNLASHKRGETISTILNVLELLGYGVKTKVLRARDFGLPQNRERIYIVGFDKSQIMNWNDFEFPIPPCTPTRVGDILETNVDEKYTLSNTLWTGHQRRKEEHRSKGNGFGYSLFTANDEYTNTISARYYKDSSEILIVQEGKNPRKITPREAARLQGFPDEFIIPVSDMQSYKQFGNSVAVPVINAIALQMLKILEDSTN